MKINKKGFTGLEVVAVLAIGWLIYTVVTPFLPSQLKGGQTTVQKSVTTIAPAVGTDGKPVYVKDSGGNISPLMQSTTSTSDEETVPKAPLWQRVIAWFARLGFAGLLLALLFPGAAIALVVWIKNRWAALRSEIATHKAALADLQTDASKIVLGMEKAFKQIPLAIGKLPGEVDRAGLAKNIEDSMKGELEKFYNDSTKSLVNSIKNPVVTVPVS